MTTMEAENVEKPIISNIFSTEFEYVTFVFGSIERAPPISMDYI